MTTAIRISYTDERIHVCDAAQTNRRHAAVVPLGEPTSRRRGKMRIMCRRPRRRQHGVPRSVARAVENRQVLGIFEKFCERFAQPGGLYWKEQARNSPVRHAGQRPGQASIRRRSSACLGLAGTRVVGSLSRPPLVLLLSPPHSRFFRSLQRDKEERTPKTPLPLAQLLARAPSGPTFLGSPIRFFFGTWMLALGSPRRQRRHDKNFFGSLMPQTFGLGGGGEGEVFAKCATRRRGIPCADGGLKRPVDGTQTWPLCGRFRFRSLARVPRKFCAHARCGQRRTAFRGRGRGANFPRSRSRRQLFGGRGRGTNFPRSRSRRQLSEVAVAAPTFRGRGRGANFPRSRSRHQLSEGAVAAPTFRGRGRGTNFLRSRLWRQLSEVAVAAPTSEVEVTVAAPTFRGRGCGCGTNFPRSRSRLRRQLSEVEVTVAAPISEVEVAVAAPTLRGQGRGRGTNFPRSRRQLSEVEVTVAAPTFRGRGANFQRSRLRRQLSEVAVAVVAPTFRGRGCGCGTNFPRSRSRLRRQLSEVANFPRSRSRLRRQLSEVAVAAPTFQGRSRSRRQLSEVAVAAPTFRGGDVDTRRTSNMANIMVRFVSVLTPGLRENLSDRPSDRRCRSGEWRRFSEASRANIGELTTNAPRT